uniref:Uncharacterized protein n=1 Tax=Anguilla anguilla TaxID=7936 RepID=A0A0E9TBC7_ANGAN
MQKLEGLQRLSFSLGQKSRILGKTEAVIIKSQSARGHQLNDVCRWADFTQQTFL